MENEYLHAGPKPKAKNVIALNDDQESDIAEDLAAGNTASTSDLPLNDALSDTASGDIGSTFDTLFSQVLAYASENACDQTAPAQGNDDNLSAQTAATSVAGASSGIPATYDENTDDQFPQIVTPYHTLEEYLQRAKNELKPKLNQNNAKIWTTRYTMTGLHLEPIVKAARREKKDLIILSGTHGARNGRRNQHSADPEFYTTDRDQFRHRSRSGRASVKIKDISRLSDAKVGKILTGPTDVVAAFCYSRNDSQLLKHLKWRTKKSYVKPDLPE